MDGLGLGGEGGLGGSGCGSDDNNYLSENTDYRELTDKELQRLDRKDDDDDSPKQEEKNPLQWWIDMGEC